MRSALSLMAHPSSTPNLTSWSRALTLSWTQNSLTKPRDRCIVLQGYYYNHSSLNKRSTYTITRGVVTGELQATHYASNSQNQNQVDFYPFVLLEISVLHESPLGHLRYGLTDVPPQPNSPPDNVFNPDRPAKDLNARRWAVKPSSASLNK